MKDYIATTLFRKVGCGNIYLIINEEEGEFYNLAIKGDNCKETPCGESWMGAIAALLTFALRRSVVENNTLKAIIRHLLNHRCNNPIKDWRSKEEVSSCSHAIGLMVLEYIKARGLDEIEKEVTIQKEETAKE